MRYLSVCSGIEAATVAWHPLGWSPVAFSEIDPFACAVLQHHYPHVPNLGDMTKFKDWPDYAIDLICGGAPCQSFSLAGLRAGLADPRGNLTLTFLAIVERYKPRFIVFENVPGILSSVSHVAPDPCPPPPPVDLELDGQEVGTEDEYDSEELHAFNAFLAGLSELGYGWATRVLDAQFVRTRGFERAVPQRRRRVFVVGYLGDWRRAAAVLFERESLLGNPPPSRRSSQDVAGTLAGGARVRGGQSLDDIPVAATVLAGDGGISGKDDIDGRLVAYPVNERDSAWNGNGVGGSDDPSPTLQSGKVHGVVSGTVTARMSHSRGAGVLDDPALVADPVAFGGNNTSGPIEVATAINAHGGPHGRLDFETETFLAVPDVAAALSRGADGKGDGGYAGRRREDDENVVVSVGYAQDAAPPLTSNPYGDHESRESLLGAHALRADGFDTSEDGTGRGTPIVPVPFDTTQITSKTNRSNPQPGDPCHPLTSAGHPPAIAFDARQADVIVHGERSGPLDTDGYTHAIVNGWAVRRLMPIECCRLQGFPDDYLSQVTWRGQCPPADGPMYKALGNSWPVNVIRWLGRRIELVERLSAELGG